MKKIVFAWLTFAYTFDTKEELDKFIIANRGKYYNYSKPLEEADGKWYLEVNKRYGKYNPGW